MSSLLIGKRQRIHSSDGTALEVVEGGERHGSPILFIHGYLFSSAVWWPQFESPLARRHRLIAMDLRGHGNSEKPSDPAVYEDAAVWADDVASVLDAMDVDRVVMVGWSLGSRVSLNYAWHHGFDRIWALNLVAASLASTQHSPAHRLPEALADLWAPDDEQRRSATRSFVRECLYPTGGDTDSLEAFTATAMGVPLVARIGTRSWAIPYDDAFGWVTAPTLVTNGARDPFVDLNVLRGYVEAMPSAELAVFPGSGHMAFYQQAEAFDRDLAKLAQRASQV